MEERAHHLGGALQIQSGAGRGTIVAVQLPLPDHPKEGLSVESVAHEIRPLRTA
jgi:signal transduction histidine kinase